MKFRIVGIVTTPLTTGVASAADPVAIYHVGNSLTDQAYGMQDIAAARGHETRFGRHRTPGARLEWLWKHRDAGFREPNPYSVGDTFAKPVWEVVRARTPCAGFPGQAALQ